MAMSRKPLSSRNNGQSHGNPAVKKVKRPRYLFQLIQRREIVSTLKTNILKPSASLCEDDLLKPTPEKVQDIYFNCLEFVFGVKPEALKLLSVTASSFGHPEMMEDFVYRIQFFRLMKRFMRTCLVNDFRLEDLMVPDSKRLCRNLSAIINFIKFHFNVYLDAGSIQEYHETRDQLRVHYEGLVAKNEELKEKLANLEKQRRDEHELEMELKARIVQQEKDINSLQLQKESLQKEYQDACDLKIRCEQRLAELNTELDKWTQRDSDLRKQLVSSPDKLKARLRHLQEEMADAKESSREIEALLRMWESLVSRGQQVPSLLAGLNDDLSRFTRKVEKKNELQLKVESMEEQLARQKQVLREATAKHQNLVRHLKLVEAESGRIAYDETKVTHVHSKEELQKEVSALEQALQEKTAVDDKIRQDMEQEMEKLEKDRKEFQKACAEITEVSERLASEVHSNFEGYREVMVRFGLDLYKNQPDRKNK